MAAVESVGKMSVFSDFQKAWGAKFPGCDLPQAWEEDVRANLRKHRHKVALLKEELEKEEFYVEYLERLLADVEKHKRSRTTHDSDADAPALGPCEIQNGAVNSGKGVINELVEEQQQQQELSPTPEKAQTPQSEGDTETLCDLVTSAAWADVNKGNHSGNKVGNQYVTVIKVNGYNHDAKTPPKMSSFTDGSGGEAVVPTAEKTEAQRHPSTKGKVPPKPPPKRSKRLVSSASLDRAPNGDNEETVSSSSENLSFEKALSQSFNCGRESNGVRASMLPRSPSVDGKVSSIPKAVPSVGSIERVKLQPVEKFASKTDEEHLSPVPTNSPIKDNEGEQSAKADETSLDNGLPQRSELESSTSAASVKMDQSVEDLENDYVTFSFDKSIEYDDLTMNSQASVQSGQSGYSSHSGPSDQDGATSSPIPPDSDSPKYSDYVNIDYFLKSKVHLKHRSASQSESLNADSDEDDTGSRLLIATLASDPEEEGDKQETGSVAPTDDVFEIDSGVYSSSVESTSYISSSTPPVGKKQTVASAQNSPASSLENADSQSIKAEAERIAMYRCIISSILDSEAIYLECLNVLLQYMKALRATFSTTQPVLSQEDFSVIFYKISDLYELHENFQDGIRNRTKNWDGKHTFGDHFKILASKLGTYASFLQNYPRAVETVRRCSNENSQFSEITKTIKLKTLKGQVLSLEDLLHKPVARVQKNALVLHDLLKYTPESHPDYKTLKMALKLTQCFLNEFNMSAAESMFPAFDRAQRHLVKNSFIVELSEAHRKLRHLFLFNDVIVCAKYKASGREKFTFEVKWYIPLMEVNIAAEEESKEIRESSPANILALKTQASTVRHQIIRGEKNSSNSEKRVSGRNVDRHRKKLAELEAQLVLASPNLVLRIGQKQGKVYRFFLSSEFERQQWIEAVNNLQSSATPTNLNLTQYELQTWISTCRKYLKTNMGAFLLRSGKDELLVGDLHIVIHSLQGLPRPSVIFICLEVDSYGNFFRKAKTKASQNSMEPSWNQDFVVELEGSQNLRILCYELHPQQGTVLRAKTTLELSQHWLPTKPTEKSVALQEYLLTMTVQYITGEMTLRRAPSSKPCGLFGIKIQQVCKKEKRQIPFLITSCVREVERRGMSEVGIYRVSGSASDVQKLKKTFETNAYEAEQLLKEVDVHSITGLLKLYLRELPEALFTDELYPKFFEGFSMPDGERKTATLLHLFNSLPDINQSITLFLIDHMVKIHQQESNNKMSLHNLATVFGPTLLRPCSKSDSSSPSDLLAAETIDVMAQAGILYFFLKRKTNGEPIQKEAK